MKVGIRDILWLTLVAALAIGWFLDNRRLAFPSAEYRELKQKEEARLAEHKEFFKKLREASRAAEDERQMILKGQ
jgi:hypothetical protein